jgi:hypothetical protein
MKGDGSMSKGNSNLFHNTLGTTVSGIAQPPESYSDRGVKIPDHIRAMIEKLPNTGDYIVGSADDFNIQDVSIMSKETGVEFAKVTIGNKSYLIRGRQRGADIPKELIDKMSPHNSSFDFHSHPYDDDLIPSPEDIDAFIDIKRRTGQRSSMIVSPNGRKSSYNETGVISVGYVEHIVDDDYKNALAKLFGGNLE